MTPFSSELMQTLEDLIPAIALFYVLLTMFFISYLAKKLSDARKTCKDQGNMLAEYVNLQADDLIKVQNAHKNEEVIRRKCNDLLRENETLKLTADNLLKRKFELEKEIKALKDKISRKNDPRDAKGHFIKTAAVKKNPNIGKYLCNDFVHNFEIGHYYERYESDTVDPRSLILIGDDRQRHSVLHTDFQLITE